MAPGMQKSRVSQMSMPCMAFFYSLSHVMVGNDRKLKSSTVARTNTMSERLPDISTSFISTVTPNADAHEATIMVNQA